MAGCALALVRDGDRVRDCRVVLSGAAPIPWRSRAAEEVIRGKVLDAALIRQAAAATVAEATLRGDFSGRPLHLDLHVYYDDPPRRLVFINGTKYREGERLEDGLEVAEIVPEGVVLDDGGRRFLLPST